MSPEDFTIRTGEVTVNLILGAAFVGRSKLRLSPQQVRILAFLLMRETASRAEILRAIWGSRKGRPSSENLITVNTTRLRAELTLHGFFRDVISVTRKGVYALNVNARGVANEL